MLNGLLSGAFFSYNVVCLSIVTYQKQLIGILLTIHPVDEYFTENNNRTETDFCLHQQAIYI